MIRHARIDDSKVIKNIVNFYAKEGQMLPISMNVIYERIFEFILWEDSGKILGVCALHPMWEDLAEIRSLAVLPEYTKKGIGGQFMKFMIKKAKDVGFHNLFALTYKIGFFKNCGFTVTTLNSLPKKIWTDCMNCPKYNDCDETAVILKLN